MPLAYAFLSMSVAALLVSEGVEWLSGGGEKSAFVG